jgi:hypothetical protein
MDVTVNRRAFSIASRYDDSSDRQYWLAQAVSDRLTAIEVQRRILYGSARATARLQRVFETAERTPRQLPDRRRLRGRLPRTPPRDGWHRHLDSTTADSAARLVSAIRVFGFDAPELSEDLFMRPDQIIRLGVPPVRIEILTSIAGVEFDECAPRAVSAVLGACRYASSAWWI